MGYHNTVSAHPGPRPFHKIVSSSLSRRFPEALAAVGDNVGLTIGAGPTARQRAANLAQLDCPSKPWTPRVG
jgi:hypothetical protein